MWGGEGGRHTSFYGIGLASTPSKRLAAGPLQHALPGHAPQMPLLLRGVLPWRFSHRLLGTIWITKSLILKRALGPSSVSTSLHSPGGHAEGEGRGVLSRLLPHPQAEPLSCRTSRSSHSTPIFLRPAPLSSQANTPKGARVQACGEGVLLLMFAQTPGRRAAPQRGGRRSALPGPGRSAAVPQTLKTFHGQSAGTPKAAALGFPRLPLNAWARC